MDKSIAPRIVNADLTREGLIVYFEDSSRTMFRHETLYAMMAMGIEVPDPEPEPD